MLGEEETRRRGGAAGPLGLQPHDEDILKLCATNLLELVPELGLAMARHIHEQVPELGGLDDAEAVEATRRSCVANLREMFVMLRAGLPATAHETPTDALEYVRFMRRRGVDLDSVLRAYQHGVSMFHAVGASEFERAADDAPALRRMTGAVTAFVFVYIDRVTERLGVEYGDGRGERRAGPDAEVWRNPVSIAAAERFLADRATRSAGDGGEVSHARLEAERVIRRFRTAIEGAARDKRVARRLGEADTTVRVELADEGDLAVTLTLRPSGIEILAGAHPAEVRLSLSSVDLERMWSGDFHLSMAIARGRVEASGPVREFLRVMPIIRRLSSRDGAPGAPRARTRAAVPAGGDGSAVRAGRPGAGSAGFDAATRAVLDQAAGHGDAAGVAETAPGSFWSIECRGVSKTVAGRRLLDGLDVGFPEGMISAVLGPSDRCKSVLIEHLSGRVLPDRGQVLVHGRPVAGRRPGLAAVDGVTPPLRPRAGRAEARVAAIARAAFSRSVVLAPHVVVLDEPGSGLGPEDGVLLTELIQETHAERGGTYIVFTQDIASARRLADYLVVLWKGRNVQSGDRDDMFTSSNPFVRRFLAGRPQGRTRNLRPGDAPARSTSSRERSGARVEH